MSDDRTQLGEDFLALLRPIRQELEAYCRRLIWNESDMPDALQSAVMNAFKAFDRYKEESNFRAWMFKILTHEVFKLNQKHGRLARFEYQIEPEELEALSTSEGKADEDWLNAPGALADALGQELVMALKTLTEGERAVLLMRAIGGFRYQEIASALDMPVGSVMGNLSRARTKMKEAIIRSQRRSVL
jgi:RNA polymerase sigma-70 factor (ECF subfamily)